MTARKSRLLPLAMAPKALAQALGLSERHVHNAIYREGSLPAYRIGDGPSARIRVTVDDALRYIKSFPRSTILKFATEKEAMTESTKETVDRLRGELAAAEAAQLREQMARGGKTTDNPFAQDEPITPAQLDALLKKHGSKRCRELAAEAGRRLDGSPIGSPFKARDYIRGESIA